MIAEKTAPSAAANLFGDAKIGFGVTFRVLSISFDNKKKAQMPTQMLSAQNRNIKTAR